MLSIIGETERTPFGVDAHAQQNVRHVVIQHVEHVLPAAAVRRDGYSVEIKEDGGTLVYRLFTNY